MKTLFRKIRFPLFFAIIAALLVGSYLYSSEVRLKEAKRVFRPFKRELFAALGIDYWKLTRQQLLEGENTLSIISPAFHIDTIYKSMKGPAAVHYFSIMENKKPELVWITGYASEIVDREEKPLGNEYMCHNNLDFNPDNYYMKWNMPDRVKAFSIRLITLTSGQARLKFPKGFGIPMMSDEIILVAAQVLNHNHPNPDVYVRHHTKLNYLKYSDSSTPPKPLFEKSVFVLRDVQSNSMAYGVGNEFISDCRPVRTATDFHQLVKEDGSAVTGHWVIPPGRETSFYNVTDMLNLPFSTTLHHAGIHMHPFAESLELRDITVDTTIFKATASNFEGKIGLKNLDFFSSEKGVMLYKNHQYQLICTTNNTSGINQDMMAVMYLYFYDKELEDRLKLYQ